MPNDDLLVLAEFIHHFTLLPPMVQAVAVELIASRTHGKVDKSGTALKATFLRADVGKLLCELSKRQVKLFHDRERLAVMLAKMKRDAKPRKGKRDLEIVRLRDEEGLSFGEIAIRINSRPGSKCDKSLEPVKKMTYRSVQAAYNRSKRAKK